MALRSVSHWALVMDESPLAPCVAGCNSRHEPTLYGDWPSPIPLGNHPVAARWSTTGPAANTRDVATTDNERVTLRIKRGSDAQRQARDPFQVPTELADGLGVESLPRVEGGRWCTPCLSLQWKAWHNHRNPRPKHPICPCRTASYTPRHTTDAGRNSRSLKQLRLSTRLLRRTRFLTCRRPALGSPHPPACPEGLGGQASRPF